MDAELKWRIEEAREKTDLVELISQTYALDEASGSYWRATQHDSLVVSQHHWWWNSHGTSGDAIDWCRDQMHMTFHEALNYLLGTAMSDHAANRATPKPIAPPRNLAWDAEEWHQGMLRSKSTIALLQRKRNLRLATILAAKLGWHPTMKGWSIPHWLHGNTDYCSGVKVRVLWKGEVRYVSVKGSRFGLYMPPPLPNLDPSMLFVVEGEWKALSIMQLGAYAVGCPAKHFLPKWWEHLSSRFGQATVYVVRDNDLAGLVFLSKVRAAIPHALPLAPPITVKAVDDWIVTNPQLTLPSLIQNGVGNI